MKHQNRMIISQGIIFLLAAIMLSLMINFAKAEAPQVQSQVEKKSTFKKILDKTTLSYYTQLLGPSLAGKGGETYNIFQEARSPYQSFHAIGLKYTQSPDWSASLGLAAVNAYGDTITNQQTGFKSETKVRDEFFNARFNLSVPDLDLHFFYLESTLSYEAPTSVFARENNMRYGVVLSESLVVKMPTKKWAIGINGQYYRMYYKQNTVPAKGWFLPIRRQTVIATLGPYVGYRINESFGTLASITYDWDQRGEQTSTLNFNNNLPNRVRTSFSYYPKKLYPLASLGLFTQGLLNYTTDTHTFGVDANFSF